MANQIIDSLNALPVFRNVIEAVTYALFPLFVLLLLLTSPDSSSTRMCFMNDGRAMSKGSDNSLTVAGPAPSRCTTALRVGSDKAWKIASSATR